MLYSFDREILGNNKLLIAGVDEAGRGPLAGPVYAAAVVLDYSREIKGINDSKKLSEKKRNSLYDEIIKNSVCYSIASVSAKEIDEINILNAAMLAMKKAVEGLPQIPDITLIDGNKSPVLAMKTIEIIKGDGISAAIAAASILAKVARDNYLLQLGEKYPEYLFQRHKGYPTKLHYQMLDQVGPCPEHRESFLRKWRAKQNG